MLSKSEVIEMLWNMNYEVFKRSEHCRERAERCEMQGDLDGVKFWEDAADADWFESAGIRRAIRAIEEM